MFTPDIKLKSNGHYWQAWWKDATGKGCAKSLGPKTRHSRRQANVLCRELAIEIARDGTALGRPKTPPRLSEWLKRYLALRTDVNDSTKYMMKAAGKYLELYFDNDPPIDQISRADAADWRQTLASGELALDNANRCDPPSESTVCKHVRTAKRMFREAEDQDILRANPFSRLRATPPPPIREWREVNDDDMQRILDACPSSAWRCLFALCYYCGLRRGEALRLRWSDIKFDANRMVVNATIQKQTTKQSVRTVPIEPAKCPSQITKMLVEALEGAEPGMLGPCHGVNISNIDAKAQQIITSAGIGLYSKPFHTLRKVCETRWAQKYPQHVVSEWIGHDITVSAAHYLRVPEELYAKRKHRAQIVRSQTKKQRQTSARPVAPNSR